MRTLLSVLLATVVVAVGAACGGRVTSSSYDVDALIAEGAFARAEQAARARFDVVRATQPASSDEYGDASGMLVRALRANGRGTLEETLTLAEAELQRQRRPAAKRLRLANALVDLGQTLTDRAEYTRAIQIMTEALAVAERAHGTESRHCAPFLTALGETYFESRAYALALPVLKRSLHLTTRDGSSDDATTTRTLEIMAAVVQRQAEYETGRQLLDRALALQTSRPADHPSRINGLNLLALQLWFEGRLVESRDTSQQALAIAEKSLRPQDPRIARTLRALAATLWGLGALSQSRALAARALGIAEQSLGTTHPEVVAYWNDLASVNLELGAYSEARTQFAEALKLAESKLGAEHEVVATVLHNLALVDAALGDLDAAHREQARTVALWERTLGPNHAFVATALGELADVVRRQGSPAGALPLLQRALQIRERTLGLDHRDTARTVGDLAAVFAHLGDSSHARRLADRAIRLSQQTDQQGSPAHATVLELRGALELSAGKPRAALPYFEQALAMRARILGPVHPLVADVMVKLAEVKAAAGQRAAAIRLAIDAENIGREHLHLMLRHLPERESLNYAAARPRGLDLVLSLTQRGDRSAAALDMLVRSRALVLDEMAARRRVDSSDPAMAGVRAALSGAQQRLANVLVRGPRDSAPDHYRHLVEEARRDKENAERALADRSASHRAEMAKTPAELSDIQRAIPADAVLVSYARVQPYRIGSTPTLDPAYLAFVTQRDKGPIAVRLGSAVDLEARVADWRSAIKADAQERSPATVRRLRRTGLALRAAIWDPLTPWFSSAHMAFIVPDAALNLVPFAALPGTSREYLVEESRRIHYLSAERDLLFSHTRPRQAGLLAVGGASFDDVVVPTPTKATGPSAPARRTALVACEAFEHLRFPALSATLAEVRDIARVWGTAASDDQRKPQLLVAREADETTFKREAPRHRVLHLATHGFFLNGQCLGRSDGTRSVSGLADAGPSVRTQHKEAGSLSLSGLAFAGANRRASATPEEDDGILTAEEVAALDLRDVEWAVLSACDTGIGDVQAGEGVLGLRRSFEIAGVGAVIMSLWPVEDEATREWMVALYAARLSQRETTAGAMRNASLSVLRARRATGASTSPFYWAAFVAAGDWR
jgi:CHAT domain-containing protein/tetratricopeptide (TPR) repeat protein